MGQFEAFVGVNFWTALFILLNTLIIFFVAKKFLFGPVMKIIADRQQEIDDMYAQAETSRDTAEKLHATAKKTRRLGYMFDSAAKLCDVLAVKYDLGVKTRAAYKAGDKAELARLAREEYAEVSRRLAKFINAFEKQWYTENKTAGFDVQELRLGGLLQRTDSCRRRLLDFANGKIGRIEELECDLLPLVKGDTQHSYAKTATLCVL